MNIRFATHMDAKRVLEIYAPFVESSPVSFETVVPTLGEFKKRMAQIQSTYPWLVGEADGQIMGYAYASPHRGRRAYCWSAEVTVYVDSIYKRKGVGRKLYEKLFELLRLQGCHLVLGGITLPNEASEGLHKNLGFSLVGVYKKIGFKLGKWHDVAWYQRQLLEERAPKEILPIEEVLRRGPKIRQVSAADPGIQKLVGELDIYLNSLYPEEDNYLDTPEELDDSEGVMLGLYVGDLLAGMGAIKFMGEYAEIKRMYIDPLFRGRGWSGALLRCLELAAAQKGLEKICLETGYAQKPALKLYRSFNYQETGPFGSYSSNESSLFMEKNIGL